MLQLLNEVCGTLLDSLRYVHASHVLSNAEAVATISATKKVFLWILTLAVARETMEWLIERKCSKLFQHIYSLDHLQYIGGKTL